MYGLPKKTDLSFLLGKQLIQVCVGKWYINLNFLGDVSIGIEGELAVHLKGKKLNQSNEIPEAAHYLFNLLQSTVKKVDIPSDGRLHIKFANQYMLTLYDSEDQYESYNISAPGNIFIVV